MPQSSSVFTDFESAARSVISYLQTTFDFQACMVTRTEGDDWIVLQASDRGYGIEEGQVFQWAESFCSRMVCGKGPCIAPASDEVPAYAEAPIGEKVEIGSYIGISLNDADGELFGTLCAIDPEPKDEKIREILPLLELLGSLLSTCIVGELKQSADRRIASLHDLRNLVDDSTGALSEIAWERFLRTEEERCRTFGHPAGVIAVLTSGEQAIAEVARILREETKHDESFYHDGNGMFQFLIPECREDRCEVFRAAIERQLNEAQVEATLGSAVRDPRENLKTALEKATSSL